MEAQKLYTTEDLLTLPDDDRQYELVRGELIIMPPPRKEHAKLQAELARLIGNIVRANDLGETTTESGYQLAKNPDTVRAPDVAFTSKERIQPVKGTYDTVAPDLVIEIVSPGNAADDLDDKITQFFEAGTRLAWVVYPKTRTIHVYNAIDSIDVLRRTDDILQGGEVLPGFQTTLHEIFSVLE